MSETFLFLFNFPPKSPAGSFSPPPPSRRLLADDNEGSSSDTAPLFQMAGDGRSTDDIPMPLLFLFHKEGNILLEALKEYREVEVLLSDKARDRGVSPCTFGLDPDPRDCPLRLSLSAG